MTEDQKLGQNFLLLNEIGIIEQLRRGARPGYARRRKGRRAG
jgi:hypothetical protein